MANRRKPLHQVAVEIAARDIACITGLEEERKQLIAKLAELEARIKAAHKALDRAQRYSACHHGDLICPLCLVRHNEMMQLHAVESAHPTREVFECCQCHKEFEIEIAR